MELKRGHDLMTKSRFKDYLALHGIMFVYSLATIASKLASASPFLSGQFILYFFLLNLLAAIYAVVWQQVIKRIPLNTAYSTKSIGIVWGVLWGRLFFMEKVTPWMVLGCLIIIIGIILVVNGDE